MFIFRSLEETVDDAVENGFGSHGDLGLAQESAFIQWLMNEDEMRPETPDTSNNVSFSLNFRATGIQSTGFKDYKEAFAALNNGRY